MISSGAWKFFFLLFCFSGYGLILTTYKNIKGSRENLLKVMKKNLEVPWKYLQL